MTKPGPLPSAELIRTHLDYNAGSGIFTWKSCLTPNVPVGKVAGSIRATGYRTISILGGKYQAHRLAWLWMTGSDPGDFFIDHINGDRDDNRWSNLRLATSSQNSANSPAQRNNSTGLKGVSVLSHSPNRWQAQITIDGENHYLGIFTSPELAHEAYTRAAKKAQDIFAVANRPPPLSAEGMREALEPFAKIAEWYSDSEDDDFGPWVDVINVEDLRRLKLKDFRRARAALSALPVQSGKPSIATRPATSGTGAVDE